MKIKLTKFFYLSSYLKFIKLIIQQVEKIIYGRIEEISIYNCKEIKIKKIFPSHDFEMPLIEDIDGNQHIKSYKIKVPQANIYNVMNGIFIPGKEEIYTSNLKVLKEITAQKINPQKGQSKKKILKFKKLKGKVLCLSLSGLERNYYHFNTEYIARWYLHKLSNINYDYIDFDEKNSFQKYFFNLLNIPKKKRIPKSLQTYAIKADTLIVPELINNWENFILPTGHKRPFKQYLPKWFKDIHKEFRKNSKSDSERIYLSRSKVKRRKVLNEEEVVKLISKYNFKVFYMEDLDVNEQIKLFNNARTIISPHGSAIANIVFCAKPFKLLEIFPQNFFDPSHPISSIILDCNYSYMIAQSPNISNIDPQLEDMYVDCKKLKKWLEKLN